MSRQTAVEWLIENYWPLKRGLEIGIFDTLKVVQQAKEMEKQQKIEFGYRCAGEMESELGDIIYNKLPEDIYNETFNK